MAGFLVGVFLPRSAAVTLAKGGFYIGKHEGDTLHLLQIVLREARGQWPHLDFQTPIGVLATAPVALFVRLGAGVGHAILYAQILLAAIALPAIWWVASSRFAGVWAYRVRRAGAGADPRAGARRGGAVGLDLDALQPLGLGRRLRRHRLRRCWCRPRAGARRWPTGW